MSSLEPMREQHRSHRRLEQLYEVSKLFATFESAKDTLDRVLLIAARTLPLRSAILIEVEDDHSRMICWGSAAHDDAGARAAKAHVEEAFAYLAGERHAHQEQPGRTGLPPVDGAGAGAGHGFIVIPLVTGHRAIFGALQLEGAAPLDRSDLIFVNALGAQLSIALDRDRVRRQDLSGRELAEALSQKHEALARENRLLYEQAQTAVHMREQILEIVSHDLRNPISVILLGAEVLDEGHAMDPQEVARVTGRIRRAAQRMRRLTEDLLDFASIETGRLALKCQLTSPAALVKEAVTSFRATPTGTLLRVDAEIAPDLPLLDCDPDRVLQVIANLVDNASKVSPAGQRVVVRAAAREPDVVFSITDSGPGILPADVRHIFDRYWRGDTRKYKGTGLGLAIARGIVEAHGGTISVESVHGQGATFSFSLPAASARP